MKHASKQGSIQERLWSRVDKSGGPDSCWNWTGSVSSAGYGMISGKLDGKLIDGRTASLLVHRVSWVIANGPIPDGPGYHGFVVMHSCDNRRCVNPAHLSLGTQATNLRDMGDKKRYKLPYVVGSFNPNAKLTIEQEAEIMKTREPSRKVAARYGVSKKAILRVRSQNMTPEQLAALRAENYRKRYA